MKKILTAFIFILIIGVQIAQMVMDKGYLEIKNIELLRIKDSTLNSIKNYDYELEKVNPDNYIDKYNKNKKYINEYADKEIQREIDAYNKAFPNTLLKINPKFIISYNSYEGMPYKSSVNLYQYKSFEYVNTKIKLVRESVYKFNIENKETEKLISKRAELISDNYKASLLSEIKLINDKANEYNNYYKNNFRLYYLFGIDFQYLKIELVKNNL